MQLSWGAAKKMLAASRTAQAPDSWFQTIEVCLRKHVCFIGPASRSRILISRHWRQEQHGWFGYLKFSVQNSHCTKNWTVEDRRFLHDLRRNIFSGSEDCLLSSLSKHVVNWPQDLVWEQKFFNPCILGNLCVNKYWDVLSTSTLSILWH